MLHKIKNNLLFIVLSGGAAFYLMIYLYIVVSRIGYPFELEWMEGGSVDHVRRILLGQPLYVEPSLDFVPYIYTPFYYYVAALFSKIWGLGFFSLRLVSFLSSLGIMVILFKIVFHETKNYFSPLIAVGLFASTFRISGAWMDIARVDSLFLFLFFLGFYFLFYRHSIYDLLIASTLIFLSFFTKQSALMMSLPLIMILFLKSKKRAAIFSLSLATMILMSTLYMDHLSHGWYSYYAFKLPKLHVWVTDFYINYWKYDLGSTFLIASIISLSFFLFEGSWDQNFHLKSFFVGSLGASWFSRLHSGGYDNVLMPAFLAITLLSCCWLKREHQKASNSLSSITSIVGLFLCVQFLTIYYPIKNQIPTQQDIQTGNIFITSIKILPEKNVYIPHHPYFSVLAGKESSGAQMMAIADILRAKDHPEKIKFLRNIQNNLLSGEIPAIVLDGEWFPQELNQNYTREELLLNSPSQSFFPLTGMMTRPRWIYRLNHTQPAATAPAPSFPN